MPTLQDHRCCWSFQGKCWFLVSRLSGTWHNTILQGQKAVARSQVWLIIPRKILIPGIKVIWYLAQYLPYYKGRRLWQDHRCDWSFQGKYWFLVSKLSGTWHNTYHTTRTEGSGKITGVIDHSKENIGTRNQGYLVPGTILTILQGQKAVARSQVWLIIPRKILVPGIKVIWYLAQYLPYYKDRRQWQDHRCGWSFQGKYWYPESRLSGTWHNVHRGQGWSVHPLGLCWTVKIVS